MALPGQRTDLVVEGLGAVEDTESKMDRGLELNFSGRQGLTESQAQE